MLKAGNSPPYLGKYCIPPRFIRFSQQEIFYLNNSKYTNATLQPNTKDKRSIEFIETIASASGSVETFVFSNMELRLKLAEEGKNVD